MEGFDWSVVFVFLKGLAPWVSYVLMGLGSAVVLGLGIDAMIPDETDGGFMKKVMGVPILGTFLTALSRFSPFNYNQPK